jgi:hypothetical protein
MNALAQVDLSTGVSETPVEVVHMNHLPKVLGDIEDFRLGCAEHRFFVELGILALPVAADNLQWLAERWCLVDLYGQDEIQQIMAYAFGADEKTVRKARADQSARDQVNTTVQVAHDEPPASYDAPERKVAGDPPPDEQGVNNSLPGDSDLSPERTGTRRDDDDILKLLELADPRDRWRHTGDVPPPAHVRNGDISARPEKPRPYRTPQATIEAFQYVAGLNDADYLKRWLEQHPRDASALCKLWERKHAA